MPLRITALLAAHNEEDIIGQVVADLTGQGIAVYLLDHSSTDETVDEARRADSTGLLQVERFPEGSGFPSEEAGRFALGSLMRRKEQLANTLPSDWFVNADADEFRESPWTGRSFREGVEVVDSLGYSAIDFALLDFWPTHENFRKGDDPRGSFPWFRWGLAWNRRQVRCWKRPPGPVDLARSAGHDVSFEGRRTFPVPFLLRHYPLRSQKHARRKIFVERMPRYAADERSRGWHVQYDSVEAGAPTACDPADLVEFDPDKTRLDVLLRDRAQLESRFEAELGAERLGRTAAEQRINLLSFELDRARSELAPAVAARDLSRREVVDLHATVSSLESDLSRVRSDLDAVRASLSWRVTGPVRSAVRRFRGF